MIGGSAVIGEDCTLTQGNVIGQLYGTEDRPTIGNGFYGGAGAKILGRIRIGNGVQVGANAVLTWSVPDGAIVANVPSRVIPGSAAQARVASGWTFDTAAEAAPVVARRFGETLAEKKNEAVRGTTSEQAIDRTAILKRLTPVLATLHDGSHAPDAIDERVALVDSGVGLRSIEFLSLICAIEEEFNLTIDESDEEVSHLTTIGSLVTFVAKRMPR